MVMYVKHLRPLLVVLALTSCGERQPATVDLGTATPDYVAQVINPTLQGGLLVPAGGPLLLWGTDGSILSSVDGLAWSHADTTLPMDLKQLAADDKGAVLIAVGEKAALLRSEDKGLHWTPVSIEASSVDLNAVVHHPPSGAWIVAGTAGFIARSLDAGKTWKRLESALDLTFISLFFDPVEQALLIGGEQGMIGRSTDAGESWRVTRLEMDTPVTAFYDHGSVLVAASARGRLLTSRDRGKNWDLHQTAGVAYFTGSAFDPRYKNSVLTAHNGDIAWSADGGKSWQLTAVASAGRKNYLSAVHYDAQSMSLLAVGHHGTMVRSHDGGRHWHPVPAEGVATSLECLVYDAARGIFVVAGEGGFVMMSEDMGRNWRQARPELSFYLREVVAVPASDDFVASGQLGAIMRSEHGSLDWQFVEFTYPNMSTPPNLRALAIAPGGGALVAAGPPGAILRAENRGADWELPVWNSMEAGLAFPSLLVDRKHGTLVAVEIQGNMHFSDDGGKEWRITKVPSERQFWHGAVLEGKSIMLVVGEKGVAARSEDAGRTWALTDTGTNADLYGGYADESTGTLFALGAGATILRSEDGGISWRTATVSGTGRNLRRMLTVPASDALVAFGEYGSIVRSEDGGRTWQAASSGTDGELRSGLVEPGSNHLILVGQQGAILRSQDAGKTWQALPGHSFRHFRSAAFNPRNGDLVAVGDRIVRLSRKKEQEESTTEHTGNAK